MGARNLKGVLHVSEDIGAKSYTLLPMMAYRDLGDSGGVLMR